MEQIEQEKAKTEAAIARVEAQIEKTEKWLDAEGLPKEDVAYWRKEKEQLRKKRRAIEKRKRAIKRKGIAPFEESASARSASPLPRGEGYFVGPQGGSAARAYCGD